ncbi:hypothetical protein K439DRAFT_603167 [Ramaria rubella]|nr:hypothetical protein K439DRAFT_603167 [Ramaria rubella]
MSLNDAELAKMDMVMSNDFAVLLDIEYQLERNRQETEHQQEVIWARFCVLYLPGTVSRFHVPPPIDVELDSHSCGIKCDTRILDDHKLWNAYFQMLVQIQHSPYFAKYLRSKSPIAADGKRLPRVLAERLLERAPVWDHFMLSKASDLPEVHYEIIAGSAVQLLSTLLTVFVKEADQNTVVPRATREGLVPWLKKMGSTLFRQ